MSDAQKEAAYQKAAQAEASGTEEDLLDAAEQFALLKDFSDSAERAQKCKAAALRLEQNELEEELPALKGVFSGRRRKEIEARLDEIAAELKKLG